MGLTPQIPCVPGARRVSVFVSFLKPADCANADSRMTATVDVIGHARSIVGQCTDISDGGKSAGRPYRSGANPNFP